MSAAAGKMRWEDQCDTELVGDGPFGDTEPIDSIEGNDSVCGAARDLWDEVVLDSEDEMMADDVKASSCAGIDGGVSSGEAGSNQNREFDLIRAYGHSAGEIDQPQVPGNTEDFVPPKQVGFHEQDEISEENALNFVEDFLALNNLKLSPEVRRAKTCQQNSASGAKGIRDVAERINLRITNQGTGIFDWIDVSDNVKHSDIMQSKRKRSNTSFHGSEFTDRRWKPVRNVPKAPREEANHEQLTGANGGIPEHLLCSPLLGEAVEAFDVGFCTQMAAEAMEALSRAAPSSSPLAQQDPQITYSTPPEDEWPSQACLTKSPQKVYSRLSPKQRLLSCTRLDTAALSPKYPKGPIRDSQLATQKERSETSYVEKSPVGENNSRAKRHLRSSNAAMRRNRGAWPSMTVTRRAEGKQKGLSLRPTDGSSQQQCSRIRQPISKMVRSAPSHHIFSNSGGIKQVSEFLDESTFLKDGRVTKQGQTDVKMDLTYLLLELGMCKYPRGKRTRRNGRRLRNGIVKLHTLTMEKHNRNNSRKILSTTSITLSDNGMSRKVHQFAQNNNFLPSENEATVKGKRQSKSTVMKELIRLGITLPDLPRNDLRKRRHTVLVQVLFSLHLNQNTITQQKKILKRLGISAATTSEDATHFIADSFVRTRNMLETMARGKPVVTSLWLVSCAQAGCLIDERNFILRDARREKELGFNMAASLANARQHPILKGKQVLVTKQVKPSKEMLITLIRAVNGQVIEIDGISSISDDLLIISCQEDLPVFAHLLNKGATVYSSELILSGVVTQKLDYERHELFKGVQANGISA